MTKPKEQLFDYVKLEERLMWLGTGKTHFATTYPAPIKLIPPEGYTMTPSGRLKRKGAKS